MKIFLIVTATFLVFFNSLPNGLVWDDHLFVEKWKEMQNFDIASLVKGSAPEAQGRLYRPIRSIIYAIAYKLWGQNPFFYHLQGILIHVGVTVLVFYIVRLILQGLSNAKERPFIAFVAALLFGLHPIHTETIDYISASMETFGSLFFFGSFYLYLRSRISNLSYLSYLFAALAFFTYEMTLTLPLLIVLYEVCFSRHSVSPSADGRIQNLSGRRVTAVRDSGVSASWRIPRMTTPYFVLLFLYLFFRVFIFGIVARTEYLGYSFYHTMLTMIKVFARYIILLFFPFNLTTNHLLVGSFPSSMLPYDRLDPILRQSLFDWDVLLGGLGILGILGIGIKLRKKFPLITFGILWFFISLLPVSYIIPHGGAMAEKYLYIASFGFVLIVAVLLGRLGKLGRLGILGSVVLLALFYGIVTFQRNTVWRNDISLFSDMEKKAPNNLLASYTLGVLYGERNHFDMAKSYYQKAINKAPDFWEARYNLGNIYVRQGRNDLAKKEYEKVLELNKDFAPARNNLDLLASHSGNLRQMTGGVKNQILNEVKDDKRDSGVGRSVGLPRMTDAVKTIKYSLNGISFEYPKDWKVERIDGGVRVKNPASNFFVEIKTDKKSETVSANEYIQKDKENYGQLVGEGLAKIPSVDFAFVKVWEDQKGSQGIKRLQFYLFKKDLVIKVLVYPSDSASMKEFDTILGSIEATRRGLVGDKASP